MSYKVGIMAGDTTLVFLHGMPLTFMDLDYSYQQLATLMFRTPPAKILVRNKKKFTSNLTTQVFSKCNLSIKTGLLFHFVSLKFGSIYTSVGCSIAHLLFPFNRDHVQINSDVKTALTI